MNFFLAAGIGVLSTSLSLSGYFLPQARELIEKLKSEKPDEREEAAKKLEELGEGALPALREALTKPDSEVVERARKVLGRINSRVATEAFRKLEDEAGKVSALRVKFKFSAQTKRGTQESKSEGEGEFLFAAENRAHLVVRMREGTKERAFSLISDGTRSQANLGAPEVLEKPVAKNFRSHLIKSLIRVGASSSVLISAKVVEKEEAGAELPAVIEFTELETRGDAAVLSYKVKLAGLGDSVEAKLWYDPKSGKPLKHELHAARPSLERHMVETYEEWEANPKIPEDRFKLVPGK